MRRALLLLFVTAFAFGCGDADTKDPVATNSGGTDAGNVNMEPDMGNGDPDAGAEPFGTTCPGPAGDLAAQECSLVDQDCAEGTCEKRILLDDMQMPTGFAVVCSNDPVEPTAGEGDECGNGVGECAVNTVCKRFAGENVSICRRWCRLEDAYGCDPNQACVPSSDLEPVFGVCATDCQD